MTQRKPDADIAKMFTDRWSPRAFSNKPLTNAQINSLFEAARWAPSCYNEQPWLFYYTTSDSGQHEKFVQTLVEQNQPWAKNAPVLIYLVGRNNFAYNNKTNPWTGFDCGSAWMSLALQARQMNLYAHAMAGFKRKAAMQFLNLNEQTHKIYAAIAVGHIANKSTLPTDMQENESPNERINKTEFVYKIGN